MMLILVLVVVAVLIAVLVVSAIALIATVQQGHLRIPYFFLFVMSTLDCDW